MSRTSRFKKGVFRYSAAEGLVIDGDLEVTGDIINAGFEPTEPFTFEQDVTMEAALAVAGVLTADDDLTVNGTATFANITVQDVALFEDNLDVAGDTTVVGLVATAEVAAADLTATDDLVVGDDASVAGKTSIHGLTKVSRTVAATADGLTTGLITADDGLVILTSANADFIATLPTAAVGIVIEGYIAATGCELRTPDASGVKINNVDADGTQELALAAGMNFRAECFATTDWKVQLWNQAGAAVAAVPD